MFIAFSIVIGATAAFLSGAKKAGSLLLASQLVDDRVTISEMSRTASLNLPMEKNKFSARRAQEFAKLHGHEGMVGPVTEKWCWCHLDEKLLPDGYESLAGMHLLTLEEREGLWLALELVSSGSSSRFPFEWTVEVSERRKRDVALMTAVGPPPEVGLQN